MSIDTAAELLTVPESHLTVNPPRNATVKNASDIGGTEFYCLDCNRKITRSTKTEKEYGHDTNCDHHQFAWCVEVQR